MDAFIIDWLSLILRWLHLITGIAWIGASFYFVWLDNSLETPPEWKKERGVSGDLWAFHGGGIYEVGKYTSAPEVMPKNLHWFKWEAYSTFITGTLLLTVVYYLRADLYLLGSNTIINTPLKSIISSLAFIGLGAAIYEVVVRKLAVNHHKIYIGILTALIIFASWLACEIFSPRAAFLHVGALMAAIMAANVFFGIIPAQKRFIAAIEQNQKPDLKPMLFAKLRSVNNNYFTLPVLFCMISNHYAFLYTHSYNWLILITIIAITAYARHFFNLRHKGIIKPQILIISSALILLLMAAMAWQITAKKSALNIAATSEQQSTAQDDNQQQDQTLTSPVNNQARSSLLTLTQKHCANCHSQTPTQAGFAAAPAGIMLESLPQIISAKDKIHVVVASHYMPLANMTQMSEQEREEYLQYIEQL